MEEQEQDWEGIRTLVMGMVIGGIRTFIEIGIGGMEGVKWKGD